MLRQVYKIDENGYAVTTNPESPANQLNFESIWLEEHEEIPEGYIPAHDGTVPLWLPRWTGTEWIEGLSQEEIDEINNVPRELTAEEKLQQLEALTVNNITNQIENQIMKGEYHGLF